MKTPDRESMQHCLFLSHSKANKQTNKKGDLVSIMVNPTSLMGVGFRKWSTVCLCWEINSEAKSQLASVCKSARYSCCGIWDPRHHGKRPQGSVSVKV